MSQSEFTPQLTAEYGNTTQRLLKPSSPDDPSLPLTFFMAPVGISANVINLILGPIVVGSWLNILFVRFFPSS